MASVTGPLFIAVNHHYVRPSFEDPHPSIFGVTPEQFEEQLRVLGRMGEFVSIAQIRRAICGEQALPDPSILITFDDGLREQYEFAWPVLQRLQIPAVFFISTAPIERQTVLPVHKVHLLRGRLSPGEFLGLLDEQAKRLGIELPGDVDGATLSPYYRYDPEEVRLLKYRLNYQLDTASRDRLLGACFAATFGPDEAEASRRLYMDIDQVCDLGSRAMIGSHTHEHLPLGALAPAEVEADIGRARALVRQWTGQWPLALSYPFGSLPMCTKAVIDAAARCGVSAAFTMERAANRGVSGYLHLARFDNNDVPGGKSCGLDPSAWLAQVPVSSWHGT